ncbi:hypothetical protein ACNOYE_34430 [Nannocystaceae bacterium ST9]
MIDESTIDSSVRYLTLVAWLDLRGDDAVARGLPSAHALDVFESVSLGPVRADADVGDRLSW